MKQTVSAALCALAWNITTANAQNTVVVQSGESLSEQDLINGTFMGQDFDLAPDTIFQIQNGGLIGPIGSSSEVSPFSFGGSSVNLEAGSNFTPIFDITKSYLSDITLNAYENSTIWDASLVGLAAQVNLHGGFYVGSLYDGATLNMDSGALIAGTKAYRGSTINTTGGLIQFLGIYEKSTINASNTEILNSFGVFSGSTANIVNSTIGPDAWIQNSTLNMTSGSIGDSLFLQGAQTVLNGVDVVGEAEMRGGNLTIIDSTFGDRFMMDYDTNVELVSGRIGDHAYVIDSFGFGNAGVLTVRGGSVGDYLTLAHRATLDVYGGEFGTIRASSYGLTINLFVTSASLNGVELDLQLFDTVEIEERDSALLEAILSDGTYFDLLLKENGGVGEDSIAGNTHLTVTLIPSPATVTLLCPFGFLAITRRRR